MKKNRERFGAAILAMALTLSLTPTSLFSTAYAAEETGSAEQLEQTVETTTAEQTSPQAEVAEETDAQEDYGISPHISVGGTSVKPKLHMDFLGDDDSLNTYGSWGPGLLPMPYAYDLSLEPGGGAHDALNATGDAYWQRYSSSADEDKVFWIGIGIDDVDAFELSQQGGLYSAEVALYYNPEFVEPMTDDDILGGGTYDSRATPFLDLMFDYNTDAGGFSYDDHNYWPYNYVVDAAKEDLDPVGDTLTEEEAPPAGWKMVYAHIYNADIATDPNRFDAANGTDVGGNPEPYYIMMFPFKLVKYDQNENLCIKLARNASTFSIGSGDTGECLASETNAPTGGFGAWERETINQGHNLKDMFDYEGDLNIFTGRTGTQPDLYDATLTITGGTGALGAELYVTSTPALMTNVNGGVIEDLPAGTKLTVHLTGTDANYVYSVTAHKQGDSGVLYTLTQDPSDSTGKTYTFIMPSEDVQVDVKYVMKNPGVGDPNAEFNAILHVNNGGDTLNTATMQEQADPLASPPRPLGTEVGPEVSVLVKRDNTVKVFIPSTYNTDYDITVSAKTTMNVSVSVTTDVPNQEYSFVMPAADVEVTVTYTKARAYKVHLSIDADMNGSVDNLAEIYYTAGNGQLTLSDDSDANSKVHHGTHAVSNDPTKYTSIIADGFNGGDPWMDGARDGRIINGVIDVHNTTTPPLRKEYQIKKVTLVHHNGDPDEELGWWDVTAADEAADPHKTGWAFYIGRKDAAGNYVPITMPSHDITIRVEFEKIAEYNVKLVLKDHDGKVKNAAILTGTNVVPPPATPSVSLNGMSLTPDNFDIYSTSILKLQLGTDPNYKVKSVKAVGQTSGTAQSIISGTIQGGVLEYKMPAEDLVITVTYEPINSKKYDATYVLNPAGPSGQVPSAKWVTADGVPVLPPQDYPTTSNTSGTALAGEITVPAGWRIATIEVVSQTGIASYPFTISGDGYNAGAGGTVQLTLTQPADNVYVKINFEQNEPPLEPPQLLNLVVVDASNTPGNQARLFLNSTNLSGNVTGGNSYSTSAAVMGNLVQVEMDCAPGYHIASVSVTPTGTPYSWESGSKIKFYMPATGVTVTVTYEAGPAPDYNVTLHTVNPVGSSYAKITNLANAAQWTDVNGTSIIANLGNQIQVDVTTDPTQKALVYACQDDTTLIPMTPAYSTVGAGGSETWTFIMPNMNSHVWVKYVDASVPLGDYAATLTVINDDAALMEPDGTAGYATLTRSGSGTGTITVQSAGAPGNTDLFSANSGDTMTLKVYPQPGYSVNVVYLTPGGSATLTVTGSNEYEFTMPSNAIGVVVRFHEGAAPQYMVNLHVYGPAGAGQASLLGASYASGIYSQLKTPGDPVKFAINCNPGYYVQSVTVTPGVLGITPTTTGDWSGRLDGDFIMPTANVNVNVIFAKGYPDEAEFDATLKVIDPDNVAGNNAKLFNKEPARLANTNSLTNGGVESVRARYHDVMEVEFHSAPGYVAVITIKDQRGNPIHYTKVDGTHIRFNMSDCPTTVTVRYEKGTYPQYKLTLHVIGDTNDSATATAPGGTATVTLPGAGSGTDVITAVTTGDTVTVNATCGTSMYVQYVIVRDGGLVPITPTAYYNAGSYTGTFAMPGGDTDVYVYFISTAQPATPSYPAILTTTATDGSASGVAGKAFIEEKGTINKSPDALSNDVSQQIIAPAGSTVRVEATVAPGYVISAIRVKPVGSLLAASVPLTWYTPNVVEFTMPGEPIEIEVVLMPKSQVSSSLIAEVLVNDAGDPGNQGIIYEDPTAVPGQTIITTQVGKLIDVDITVAAGYEIEYVELRYNGSNARLPLVAAATDSQTISFTMPPYNALVYVKMKKSTKTDYTATLKIVDTSMHFVNSAEMTANSTTVQGSGSQITALPDGMLVEVDLLPGVTPWPSTEVRLVGVIAEDRNGAQTLSAVGPATKFQYNIDKSDVTITVIYADVNEDPAERTYIAKVVKDDPMNDPGNTVAIKNLTNTALPHSTAWTEAWPEHALRVDVTVASGYYAVITAKRDDNNTALAVLQFNGSGTATGYLNMPPITSSDVTVTVEFKQGTPPVSNHTVTIDLVDNSALGGSATLTETALPVNTNTDTTGTVGGVTLPQQVAFGNVLDVVGAPNAGAHVASATITANGITVVIPVVGGQGSVTMPDADATVTVTLEALEASKRPYDPQQDPNGKGYIPGYLIAQNLGGGRAEIKVPYLYDRVNTYDAPNTVDYKLYVKVGSHYVELIRDVDYEVVDGYDAYSVAAIGASTGIATKFTIRALKGNSNVSDWIINGGVIYITATEPGKAESEYVEVELAADPGKGNHKATLRIVDFSHLPGNGAEMSDGYTVVNVDGGTLYNLIGNEHIRTSVTVGAGATLVAVTVQDSSGERPLSPEALLRYVYDMTGEDIVITVYFDDIGTVNDPQLYIATVEKAGLHGVAGNDATIHNTTRNDLPEGRYWAAGYAGNDMTVNVTTAPGYYAIVTAKTEGGITLPVVQLGVGNGTPFDVYVSIPNDDPHAPDNVVVTVTYTKDPPPPSDLTLTTVDTASDPLNTATLTPNGMTNVTSSGDGSWRVPNGSTKVTAGTKLDLTTTSNTTANYYVDKVEVLIGATIWSPATTMQITLNSSGAASFLMPLGATEVKVTWKLALRTPRPYDNTHDTGPFPAPATQDGYILAKHTLDQQGNPTSDGLEITVPTLRDVSGQYYDAINPARQDDIVYKFYTKDQYGNYHLLTSTDMYMDWAGKTLSTTTVPPTFNSVTFDLKSLLPASTLHYYIKYGGVIYITATDVNTPKNESDYTEVIIPANHIATLVVLEGSVTGNTAKMVEDGNNNFITAPPTSKLYGLAGTETLTTTITNQATGSHLVSVIVTQDRDGSTRHITPTGTNYDYTMIHEDVTVTAIFQDDSDPLGNMYTATVYKVGHDNKLGNTATISNEEPGLMPSPHFGTIWTGAYATNPIRVTVTTEPGYYATITAVKTGTTDVVAVYQLFAGYPDTVTGDFYMPAADVDVTVTYSTTPPAPNDLELTLVGASGAAGNSGTLKAPDATNMVTIQGNTPPMTQAVPNQVSTGTALDVSTTTDTGYAVQKVEMNVWPAGGGAVITTPVLMTSGASVPPLNMPLGKTEVVVTFEPGNKTPRPYDPEHANVFTSTYNHHTAADLSSYHQDGWILAKGTGKNSLQITVPTLHDKTGGTDTLYHAGYASPAQQPTYKLYWKDNLGFHEFTSTDITISGGTYLASPVAGTYSTYDAYRFDVKVNSAYALWGGYTLDQYLKNGGSIWITATGTNALDIESEKTEVVVPKNSLYKATLHISDVSGLSNSVKMEEVGGIQTPVTTHLGQLIDLSLGTTVKTTITLAPGARIASVVATANGSSINLTYPGGNIYDYVMGALGPYDVDIYVVIQDESDPLGDMYIATVYKIDPDTRPGNYATISNETVSAVPSDSVWTGAYANNSIKVDVYSEPGYYVTITAKESSGGATVFIGQVGWGNNQRTYGSFTMPASNVDVTVTYSKTPPTPGKLKLTITGDTDNNALNSATLTAPLMPGSPSVTVKGTDSPLTKLFPTTRVNPGERLHLTTTADTTNYYIVKSAEMKVTVGAYSHTYTIPLTSGVSVPDQYMYLADEVEVIVTFEKQANKTPRPYDPNHANHYEPSYTHNSSKDLSTTHQDGWILATVTGTDSLHIVVPTLHDQKGGTDNLYHAGDPTPTYRLYWWHMAAGRYEEFTSTEIEIKNGNVLTNYYDDTVGATGYKNGYEFDVKLLTPGSQWGGYKLEQYLKNGGSIWITATGTGANDKESEKTEIVIPKSYIATLHIVDTSGTSGSTVQMKDITNNHGTVTQDGQKIYALDGTETIETTVAPATGVRVAGVVATVNGSSLNLNAPGGNVYDYVMQKANVDIYVILQADDDPLGDMYIATVYKIDPDAKPLNTADVIENETVTPGTVPVGTVWTGGYGNDVIRVDITTEPGYYAIVTAKTSPGSVAKPVLQGGVTGSFSAWLYMPPGTDVDIFVEFTTTPPADKNLTLTLDQTGGTASGNKATLTVSGGAVLSLTGTDLPSPPTATTQVAANTTLDLTTAAANGWVMVKVVMEVDVDGDNVADFTREIPTTNGVALPSFTMPYGDTKVTVYYEQGSKTPRPYDPEHANVFTPSYNHHTSDDLSQTHQDGWILGDIIGTTDFEILVPTLHDMSGTGTPADKLHNAGDPTPPTYKLYWKDSLGTFHEFTSADITITAQASVSAAYGTYSGYKITGTVANVYEKWGGYTLAEYLKNGGSIWISATHAGMFESEKTEVVFKAGNYKATLKFQPNGSTATMTAWSSNTSTDGGILTGSNGVETVKVDQIVPATGYSVVGVVATTSTGSVNATAHAGRTEFTYTMRHKDVVMQVIYKRDDDPLGSKGPYIVTVNKVGDDGLLLNDATVEDMNITMIPPGQKGDIWTLAYEGNTVRVDVTTAPGYYAVISATRRDTGDPVSLLQYPNQGKFIMVPSDVDVTVQYIKGTMPDQDLTLEVVDPSGMAGNTAEVKNGTTPILNANGLSPTTDGPVSVTPGTLLTLETGFAPGHSVVDAKIIVNGTSIDIPLTSGVSLPLVQMPMADAKIVVTFENKAKWPRPFDPNHSEVYNPLGGTNPTTNAPGDYQHNNTSGTNPDRSQTHQEGWILAETTYKNGKDTLIITVPVLHDKSGTGSPTDQLHPALIPPDGYKLYWKDGLGNFNELVDGVDVDIDWLGATTVSNDYYDFSTNSKLSYTGLRFEVTLHPTGSGTGTTLWGGYRLNEYMQNGGSIWITAYDISSAKKESEKTEVVILGKMPRPYDPEHSEAYNPATGFIPGTSTQGDYEHNKTSGTNPDLSTTHQEGWIKAGSLDAINNEFEITIPTLHGDWGTPILGTLYDVVQNYKFYYKNTSGNFVELVTTGANPDISLSGFTLLPGNYTVQGTSYTGCKFTVSVVMSGGTPATTGGTELAKYIADGGSIWVSAIDSTGQKQESDKTEVVLDNGGLRPYDPDNVNNPAGQTPYDDHWITSENRGDYLIVTVPVLAKDDGSNMTNVDKTKHTFHFYLEDTAQLGGSYTPESLDGILELTHPDSTSPDPYENNSYYPGYDGARFILKVKDDADIEQWVDTVWVPAQQTTPTAAQIQQQKDRLKELAAMVKALMDNAGTTEAIQTGVNWKGSGLDKYRLYITHKEDDGSNPPYESKLVDFEIPKYYSLNGMLESYAPKHDAKFTLYPLKSGGTATVEADYDTTPFLTWDLTQTYGTGLWVQEFSLKSSHLMNADKLGQTYMLVVEKPGHVTFTWLGLDLYPATLDTPTGLTFTLDGNVNDGVIALIGGDFNNNGKSGEDDLEIMTGLMSGEIPYNRETNTGSSLWPDSIYNPASAAYAADLDGNGKLSSIDLRLLNAARNFRKSKVHYQTVKPELINGTAGPNGGGVVAFSLLEDEPVVVELLPEELPPLDAVENPELPPEELPPTEGEEQPVEGEELPEEPSEEPGEELPEEPTEEPDEELPEEPIEEPDEELPEEPSEEPDEEIPEEPTEEPDEEIPEEPSEEPGEEIPEEPSEEPDEEIPEEPSEPEPPENSEENDKNETPDPSEEGGRNDATTPSENEQIPADSEEESGESAPEGEDVSPEVSVSPEETETP